jgi:hypothetical protein
MIDCKICGKVFSSEKGLHCHLKQHQITMAEYYTSYFPRVNKLTGEPLPFRNKEDYFSQDFSSRAQLVEWCESADMKEVKPYILSLLKKRISSKSLTRGPSHIELVLSRLPSVNSYKEAFGSYTSACNEVNVSPLFGSRLPKGFAEADTSGLKIFIDTREQQPLVFDASELMKLDFGDYTAAGKDYSYTYVDRKSPGDFIGTLSLNNLDRFRNELIRARDMDCYLFIVTESDVEKIHKHNRRGAHFSNLKFIYHNMRVLAHEFADSCQFIFTGSRAGSEFLIPYILKWGRAVWDVDLQYYIDCHELGRG